MKVKLNLDKQSIKTFLLEHTEKVVFGVVALCFLLIVYNAIGRDGFDRTPEQLRTAVARAEEHIEREPPETGEDEIEPVNGPTVQHLRDHPIQTAIDGMIRGLLYSGRRVPKGMKLGDIDSRGDVTYLNTISDKGRAIGGAVLEAILGCFN